MYDPSFERHLRDELNRIRENGLFKKERVIVSPQGADVSTEDGDAVNFCANNYLGLCNHPDVLEAAAAALNDYGFGLSSVRFICGTQDLHKRLEKQISQFLETDDTILYTSCFDANGGLFETLLGREDFLVSDALNHASVIDGVRLCKAQRGVYKHADMDDLDRQLEEHSGCRFRLIATDGVFSMHGDLAPLQEICDLAERHRALVMVDDSHATGFVGDKGRGTPEHFDVADRVDIITSTLGKALGGASGGFTTGRREIIDMLRQRSRPYLFSNTIAPPVAAGSLKALELLQDSPQLLDTLRSNTDYFRRHMTAQGFDIQPGIHPIVPIMLGDEKKTVAMADELNREGIFVVGFSFPVVPKGQARIRVQISAAHSKRQLERAVETFARVGRRLGVIG